MDFIFKKDILESKFIKIINKSQFKILYPTREEAEKLNYKTLCIFVGVDSLRHRDIQGAVKNANFWLEKKTKPELLDLFFPVKKDTSLNSMF